MDTGELSTVLEHIEKARTDEPLTLSSQLRAQGYAPALVAQALTQHRLRQRAVKKMGPDAAHMYFTESGLEQATRLPVAQRRASRFVAVGARNIIDLGCGIGADLITFARAGLHATGVEHDAPTADIAAANIAALGLKKQAHVRHMDATNISLTEFDAVYCDPARRGGGRRIFNPDDFSPPWSFVTELLTSHKHAGVKLGPGLAHELIPQGVEAEWVSCEGTVVELSLWSRAMATSTRRAVIFTRDGRAAELVGSGQDQATVGRIGKYLYDPDGAIVRSHLIAELAQQLDTHLLDEHIAYLTGDNALDTPFARRLEVLEVLPFSLKRVRSWLRERQIGTVEIKKRGTALTPEQLRPQLKLRGAGSAVIVLTRIGKQPVALMCR